jgi:hypothetical protein
MALPACASTVITDPTWDGSATIGSIGYPDTSTYGEAITTPAGASNVSSFSFWLNENPGFEFQAFVSPWDNSNYVLTGSMLYLSPVTTVSDLNNDLVEYTFNDVNASVTPGTIYMFGVTVNNVYAYDSAYGAGSMGGDIFANGNSTNYFAWNNDSGDGTQLYSNWNNTGCADNGGSCGQAAFSVTYADTPEPNSLFLLGTGVLGLAGVVRRKLRV